MFPIVEGKLPMGVIGSDLVVIGDINHRAPDAVGFTISYGIGVGIDEEFHIQWGQTITWWSTNIFDIWDEIYEKNNSE